VIPIVKFLLSAINTFFGAANIHNIHQSGVIFLIILKTEKRRIDNGRNDIFAV
jgi:hypothetical protein